MHLELNELMHFGRCLDAIRGGGCGGRVAVRDRAGVAMPQLSTIDSFADVVRARTANTSRCTDEQACK